MKWNYHALDSLQLLKPSHDCTVCKKMNHWIYRIQYYLIWSNTDQAPSCMGNHRLTDFGHHCSRNKQNISWKATRFAATVSTLPAFATLCHVFYGYGRLYYDPKRHKSTTKRSGVCKDYKLASSWTITTCSGYCHDRTGCGVSIKYCQWPGMTVIYHQQSVTKSKYL